MGQGAPALPKPNQLEALSLVFGCEWGDKKIKRSGAQGCEEPVLWLLGFLSSPKLGSSAFPSTL